MKKTKSTPRATPRRCAVSTGSGIPVSSLRDGTVFWWRPSEDAGPYLRKSQVQEIQGHAIAIRDGDRLTSYPQWLDFGRIVIVRVDCPNDQDQQRRAPGTNP